MQLKLKKIDAIVVVTLIIVSGIFLVKAGYFQSPIQIGPTPPPEPENETTPPEVYAIITYLLIGECILCDLNLSLFSSL